jgi:hypothetical protein
MPDVIFIGPTLPRAEVQGYLPDAIVLGPAACGDILRATRAGAGRICLIDGYFDHRLSVWHKEILWALTRRVQVYGAASMGALRAAELHSFGMLGVGEIFKWYRAGIIDKDDEVAVAHESADRAYHAVSDAMVNIRATLTLAQEEGIIDAAACQALLTIAASQYYPVRRLRDAVALATQTHSAAAYDGLQRWLGAGCKPKVDQKARDAWTLLRTIKEGPASSRVDVPPFDFEYTEVWHELFKKTSLAPTQVEIEMARKERSGVPEAAPAPAQPAPRSGSMRDTIALLEQAHPQLLVRFGQQAVERALALCLAELNGLQADPTLTQQASEAFRRERGLLTTKQTLAWLELRGLNVTQFSQLMHDDVLVSQCDNPTRERSAAQLELLLRASSDEFVSAVIEHLRADTGETLEPVTQDVQGVLRGH